MVARKNESSEMRRNFNPSVPDTRTSECLDVTRRLYRGITDVAKRLDEQRGSAIAVTDLFTPSGEVLRAKLKDYCERLIFKDPVGHARKTEEVLWRKGFYEAVSTAKKLRKGNAWSETEQVLLSSHLAVGVGFYHHLILKLQSECELDLVGAIDFADPRRNVVVGPSNQKGKLSQNKFLSEEIRQCAVKIIHRSLVCLGDLARYRLDLDPNWDPLIATRYYKMAINIDPSIGMPHNQLGTMAGNKNHGLDAIYHYTRCILCSESFEGTEGNLKRILAAHSYNGREKTPFERCAARLFSLLQRWDSANPDIEKINQACEDLIVEFDKCPRLEKTDKVRGVIEEDSIDAYLQNCKIQQSSELTDEIIFKIVAICLMTIAKLLSKDSCHVQGAIAFTLTIMSQLMQITINKLLDEMSKICADIWIEDSNNVAEKCDDTNSLEGRLKSDKDNNISEKKPGELTDEANHVDFNDNEEKKITETRSKSNGRSSDKKSREKSKNLLTKLRRPRKRLNSSDSDASDFDNVEHEVSGTSSDEMNSDISETDEEEGALSDFNANSDDPQSEDLSDDEEKKASENGHAVEERAINDEKRKVDENPEKGEKDISESRKSSGTLEEETKNDEKAENSRKRTDKMRQDENFRFLKRKMSSTDMIDILSGEASLQSIKICFDFLREYPKVFRMFAESSGVSLKRLATLLNIINVNDIEFAYPEAEGDYVLTSGPKRMQESTEKIPLPEDTELRGLEIFKKAHRTIDWSRLRHARMHKKEETILRARKLIDFGNFICTNNENSGLKWDNKREIFVAEEIKKVSVTTKDAEKRANGKDVENERSKGKLMRHMGKLWLKAEVRALESRLRSKLISPYLVPDQEALAKHTPALKRLVYAKKFIVIIPSVVVSALDEMKKTSSKAREATRWLEGQLRKGSRFLRAQRPQERLPLPLIKGPRTKDKEAWQFFQIIECCHYLTQQTKVSINGEKEPPVVTLLTGISAEERKAAVFSPDGLAKTAGVNLEHIETFHTKWKTSSKSHG